MPARKESEMRQDLGVKEIHEIEPCACGGFYIRGITEKRETFEMHIAPRGNEKKLFEFLRSRVIR